MKSASIFKSVLLLLLALIVYGCRNNTPEKTNQVTDTTAKPSTYVALNTNYIEKRLSNQFDIQVSFIQIADTVNKADSCNLRIVLSDRQTQKALDTLTLIYPQYCYDIFSSRNSIRSYTTGFNADSLASDNYFGDIVVADFNFDKKDDIAIFSNCGGNGGPTYQYYVQNSDSTFAAENYLTDTMRYFPEPINAKKKQLTTYVHAGARCMGRHIYQYNSTTATWKQISHKILGR